MSTKERDIVSFRNIIKALDEYTSVGTVNPDKYFTFDDVDDNHCPIKLRCELLCVDQYSDEEIVVDEDACVIFFHLVESKNEPKFLSMKSWWGCNDFTCPEFIWDEELQLWSCDSFGSGTYIRFLEPFIFEGKSKGVKHNEDTLKLMKGKRFNQEDYHDYI